MEYLLLFTSDVQPIIKVGAYRTAVCNFEPLEKYYFFIEKQKKSLY